MNIRNSVIILLCVLATAATLVGLGLARPALQEPEKRTQVVELPFDQILSKRELRPDGGIKEPSWSLGPEIVPPEAPRRRALTFLSGKGTQVMEEYWGENVTVYGEGEDKSVLVFGSMYSSGGGFLRAHLIEPVQGALLLRYDIRIQHPQSPFRTAVSLVARGAHRDGIFVLLNGIVPRIVAFQRQSGKLQAVVSMDRQCDSIRWGYGAANHRELIPTAMYEVLSGSMLAIEWSDNLVNPWAQILMLVSLRDLERDVQHLVTRSGAERVAGLKGCTMIAGSGIRYVDDDGDASIHCTQVQGGKQSSITVTIAQPIYTDIVVEAREGK